MDVVGFSKAVQALKREAFDSLSEADFRHMRKMERIGRLFTIVGYATAWIIPNPISAFCISMGIFTRWMLMHHIGHGGYDRVPGVPEHYTSKGFAKGWRRYTQWFDWIIPEGWNYEHNVLHHYHTGEGKDPDLVERHVQFLRNARVPRIAKYVFVFIAGMTWKFTYYAPNTVSVLDPKTRERLKPDDISFITILNVLDLRNPTVRRLWISCYLPYGLWNFVVVPAMFWPLFGTTGALFVLANRVLAEAMTNFHAFLVVGPNHSGDDLFRYAFHFRNKEQFYVTQVLGSVNYHTGTDLVDYAQIWLNYQIEHHLFPDLPMTKYQELQPKVKALCEEHGIPYVQESVFKRFWKMVQICVGTGTMQQADDYQALLAKA